MDRFFFFSPRIFAFMKLLPNNTSSPVYKAPRFGYARVKKRHPCLHLHIYVCTQSVRLPSEVPIPYCRLAAFIVPTLLKCSLHCANTTENFPQQTTISYMASRQWRHVCTRMFKRTFGQINWLYVGVTVNDDNPIGPFTLLMVFSDNIMRCSTDLESSTQLNSGAIICPITFMSVV